MTLTEFTDTVGLRVRLATPADLGEVQRAYRETIADLDVRGVNLAQWDTEVYPTDQHVADFLYSGNLHLAHDTAGQLVGAVLVDHRGPEGYDKVPWGVDATGEEMLCVHALVVVPAAQRHGVARFLVEYAITEAKRRGCRTVRLETVLTNTPAQDLYRKCGFTDMGINTLYYGGQPFKLRSFEYVL